MAEQKKQDTNQLLKVRREKLADLQANGKDPFQITKFDQTHHSLSTIFKKDEKICNFSARGANAKKAWRGRAFSLVKKGGSDYN